MHETHDAIIQFEEKSFKQSYEFLPKTASDQQLFDTVVDRAKETRTAIYLNADDLSAPRETQYMAGLVKKWLGATQLKAGKTNVFNKEAGKPATVIEYEPRNGTSYSFFFEGSSLS